MRIGELAHATGERVKTLRYWEDRGLLVAQRSDSGYRHFDPDAVERAGFIRSAQALGFTLDEIGSVLELRAEGVAPCDDVRRQLRNHLATVRARRAQLERLEADLGARLAWAEQHPAPACEVGCVYLGNDAAIGPESDSFAVTTGPGFRAEGEGSA